MHVHQHTHASQTARSGQSGHLSTLFAALDLWEKQHLLFQVKELLIMNGFGFVRYIVSSYSGLASISIFIVQYVNWYSDIKSTYILGVNPQSKWTIFYICCQFWLTHARQVVNNLQPDLLRLSWEFKYIFLKRAMNLFPRPQCIYLALLTLFKKKIPIFWNFIFLKNI